jgi:phage portal protein BeeE
MQLDSLFHAVENRTAQIRGDARALSVKSLAGGVDALTASGAISGGGAMGMQDDVRRSLRQYTAYRDTAYTAIRPIAVRIAQQPFRVGVSQADPSEEVLGRMRTAGNRELWSKAPRQVQSLVNGDAEIVTDHPVLSLLNNPNPYMTGWAMVYCSIVSLYCTGRFVWWFDRDSHGNERIFYLPSSWATPHHDGRPFSHWTVQPPGSTTKTRVESEDIFYCFMPDPANPLDGLAPLQANAKAVNTEDKIQAAQYALMSNDIRPGMVLVAGRMPDPRGGSGAGPRPILTPKQRKQLIGAIQSVYRGVQHYGEPIIVDGMIENVYPYTRTASDLDFPAGSKLTKDRIMQGIGTSPVIAGHSENVNRATSYSQHEIFYDNTVNPVISLVSASLTLRVGPRFSTPTEKISVWLELAEPNDPDLLYRRVALGRSVMTRGEMRRYIATGKVSLSARDDDDEMFSAGGRTEPAAPGRDGGQESGIILPQN